MRGRDTLSSLRSHRGQGNTNKMASIVSASLTQDKLHNNNLFAEEDASLFRTLLRGEFFITGFTNKALQPLLPDKNSAQITRLLARLRIHHLIKKVGQRYKYYLTDFGRQVVTMALKLREMVVIPGLASNAQA